MVKKINKPDETPQSVETSENGVNKQTSTNDELAGELSLSSKKNPMKISIPLSPDEEHIAFFDQYTEKLCDAIEYTTFEHDSYPGVYKKGVWESTDSIEEDTFVLAISYYDNNLYTITVLSTDWNQEEHPWSSYPHEMIELFKQVAEKWNVSFPLLEDDFKTSKIIVNKAQLDEFLEDMKMDATKIFKHPAKAMDTVNSSFIQTDDGYEIKNIFPTDVSDKGTFSLQHESLEDTDNGEIYTSCLKQNIAGNHIIKAGLGKLIKNISLTYLPNDLIQIELIPEMTNDFSWISVQLGWNEFNEYGNFMRYLQDNLRRQYELAKKWNIDMPLVSGLKLEYFSKSITLDQSKLPDFLYDLGIPSRAVKLPMAKEVEIDEHQEFSKNDEKILEKNLLNEKIELLHKCLTPSDIPAELPECLSKYTDAFTTFKESVQGCMDGLGDQYIKALSTFRDIILEQ